MAVIASIELDDLVATGGGACNPYRGHARLSAGIYQADFFRRGDRATNDFRKFYFEFGRCAKTESAVCLFRNRFCNTGIAMAEDGRTIRADVIYEAVLVGIEDISSTRVFDKKRRAFDCGPRADRRIYRAGNFFQRALKKFTRPFVP